MRIALLGGVFGDPMGEYAASAPEAVLLRSLRELGHEVIPVPLAARPPLDLTADIFHANHFGLGTYNLALRAARPLVFTPHSGFLLVEGARSSSRLERRLEDHVLRCADVVVALSDREAEILASRYGVDDKRLEVIPNGLELERYGPPVIRDDGELRFLAVGQMIPLKGHEFLLGAIAAIAPRWPNVRLEIISQNQELRPFYEQRSRELGIAEKVSFAGLSTEQLVERYRTADVLVHPSLIECFPITIAEAMACGLPVIATDVGGVAEEVGAGGLIVSPTDVPALAAAIEQLASNPAERARIGAAGAARARAHLDSRAVTAKHVELYRRLESSPRTNRLRGLGAAALTSAYARRGLVSRFIPDVSKKAR